MTVKELKRIIENLDDDMKVLIQDLDFYGELLREPCKEESCIIHIRKNEYSLTTEKALQLKPSIFSDAIECTHELN